jgi:hypothetical protein
MAMRQIPLFALVAGITTLLSCRSTQERFVITERIPRGSNIAVLVEGGNDIKNVVFMEFMNAGYAVKAFNATDFYAVDDVIDVKDLKKQAFVANIYDPKNPQRSAVVSEKIFENIYKLHIFNFENLKAEMLQNLQRKLGIRYVVILSFAHWDAGYSWARVIKLDNMEVVYVHNYPTHRKDSYQTVSNKMISIMQNGK